MRRLAIALVFALSGCTHLALQRDTVRTTNTLADLQFQQVLDNVARFEDNPDTIPSVALATSGTVSISDETSAGFEPTLAPALTMAQRAAAALPSLELLFPFKTSRATTENWSLTPVTDADNLQRLRCAYQMLVLGEANPHKEFCRKQMQDFFAGEVAHLADNYPPRGWYCVGRKCDVPHGARYVGHHNCVYVWVMDDGMEGFSRFTMGWMDLTTGKLRTPTRNVVRKYKGEIRRENLVETEVTTIEIDPEALQKIREGREPVLDRSRVQPPLLNPGLFVLPRPGGR